MLYQNNDTHYDKKGLYNKLTKVQYESLKQ